MARRKRRAWPLFAFAVVVLIAGWIVLPIFLGGTRTDAGPVVADGIRTALTGIAALAVLQGLVRLVSHAFQTQRAKSATPSWSALAEARPETGRAPACPKCNAPMMLRRRQRDGVEFFGCSRFPACRATLPAS